MTKYFPLRNDCSASFVGSRYTVSLRSWLLLVGLLVPLFILLWLYLPSGAQAGVNCSAPYLVDQTFRNGARWQLCWEQRNLDGIVLRSVYFTPPGGTQQRVLAQGSISQVHVPYDDNSARFHDITDDGFGNENLNDLTPEECPEGTLLKDGAKDVLCRQLKARGPAFQGLGIQEQGELLSLFSVSTSGEYNYIPVWRFFDDGSIELIMGATGKLQRFTANSQFGWPVRASGTRGTSHIHNYYWRLDFDLGESGEDDVVEELNYMIDTSAGNNGGAQQRALGVSRLTTEAGRSIAPAMMRSWRIRDGAATNATGRSISYHLEPMEVGHRNVGPSSEPWTANDFYVTTYNACEKYVSHNPRIDGCGSQLGEFVNGESLIDADPVLWYGLTFHHIPRDEDEIYMHAHWDGFRLVPRDWMVVNPSAKHVVTCAVGDVNCDGQQDAADALFMLQHDVRSRTLSAQVPPPQGTLYGYSCDVSGEGACSGVDAMVALQCSVGLANQFCPDSGGVPPVHAQSATASAALLTVGAVTADAANRVSLQVEAPTPVGALSVALAYDPALVTAVRCAADPEQRWDAATCAVDETAGVIRWALVATAGSAADTQVGTVEFTWQTGAYSDTPFSVQSFTGVDPSAQPMATAVQMSALREQLFLPFIAR